MKSQIHKSSPVRISFLTLKVSTTGVMIPSMVPNMLPSPRFTSMRKNITDQKGDAGKCVIASVKAIKAKPVPWTACKIYRIAILVRATCSAGYVYEKAGKLNNVGQLLEIITLISSCCLLRNVPLSKIQGDHVIS